MPQPVAVPGSQEEMGVGILQAVANCVAHPLLEGREGRESIGKRGKDRVRRDFWEASEGWGSHSSLKREEEDRSEATPERRSMHETSYKETGTRLDI